MSVFVQQQHSINDFSSSDSWVILSEIELSIKRKIEAAGTPLKDWDIQIYRGVLTGYNEAFIISTEKRDEILANCHSEEERAKTAELIRPILRGRDIKRYGYDWAGLWLINTHNGVKGVKRNTLINTGIRFQRGLIKEILLTICATALMWTIFQSHKLYG